MMYVRYCRVCKKFQVTHNDNTYKDKKTLSNYEKANLICECE